MAKLKPGVNNMSKQLPKGFKTLEDQMMIDYLLKDQVFLESVETDMGKLRKIFPDWEANKLVYIFEDGEMKESDLLQIVYKLRKINYMKEFSN